MCWSGLPAAWSAPSRCRSCSLRWPAGWPGRRRDAGDELLRSLAAVLVDAARPGDLVARLNGDEFGVCLYLEADGRTLKSRRPVRPG